MYLATSKGGLAVEALRNEGQLYTYADYCTWDDGMKWELIDGKAYSMAPAPAWEHQRYSGRLFKQLAVHLEGKSCEVFAAPFDVRLNADTDDNTVVQPDLVVICDSSILSGTGCAGSPDMVVEILSPSTAAYDKSVKLNLYMRAGVREYWIVDSDAKLVHTHVLENGRYFVTCYVGSDAVPAHVLEGCMIDLSEVFR